LISQSPHLQSNLVPALDPMRIRLVQWLTALSTVILAGCDRSSSSTSDLSNKNNHSPPLLEAAEDSSQATRNDPKESPSVRSDPPDATSSVSSQPPPRGSKLSPEEAHRLLTGAVQFNPGAIQSSGIAVEQDTPLRIGQDLQVKYGSTWWAASIVGFEPDGRVRIHYFGWADSYDELKSRAELQLDPDAPLRAIDQMYTREGRPPSSLASAEDPKSQSNQAAVPPGDEPIPLFALSVGESLSNEDANRLLTGTVLFNPGPIASSDNPVQTHAPLSIGQDLQVKWGNTWWAATIRGFEPDGRVRIHYFGWADSYDEPKSRAELQLDPHARTRAINVAFPRSGQ
jgi:hypothetical protein